MGTPQLIHTGNPTNYAGFWLRFAAALIDSVTLFIPLGIVAFVVVSVIRLASAATKYDPGVPILAILPLVTIVTVWFYFAFMESSAWQATIGKKILRLYVTDIEGHRLTIGRSTGRTFAKYLSSATAGVGYIMCGFTQKKQALHDIVAKCLVLRTQQQP